MDPNGTLVVVIGIILAEDVLAFCRVESLPPKRLDYSLHTILELHRSSVLYVPRDDLQRGRILT